MKNQIGAVATILSFSFFISCQDKPIPPVVTTATITEISTTSAVSGGNVTDDGGASIISRGVCWGVTDNPVMADNKTSNNEGTGSYTSNITLLSPATYYFVRAYATNSAGTGYGSSLSFKTLGDKPSSTSVSPTQILTTSAYLNGTVNPNSLTTTVMFEYGLTTSYGNSSAASQSPLNGEANINVAVAITGLTPGKLHHFRIKAENSLGITYSNDLTFTTLGSIPAAVTRAAANIKMNSATINGSVSPNFLSTTITFEWGTTTSYGNTITSIHSPENPSINASADLSNLIPETTYHFRIKATNELGTTIGDDIAFKSYGVMDADGNGYYSVIVGTQIWLSENLKTTKYDNGDLIGTTTPANLDISGEATPKYQWVYNGNTTYGTAYGRLYTLNVATDSRKLCPAGWHLPSKAEWITLVDFLGGESAAGPNLKETGNSHWDFNTDATNSSKFTALAGGVRFSSGTYWGLRHAGVFWTTTGLTEAYFYVIDIYSDRANIDYATQARKEGLSVRCIKD